MDSYLLIPISNISQDCSLLHRPKLPSDQGEEGVDNEHISSREFAYNEEVSQVLSAKLVKVLRACRN